MSINAWIMQSIIPQVLGESQKSWAGSVGKLQLSEKHDISQVTELEAQSIAHHMKSALSAISSVITPAIIQLGCIVQVNGGPCPGSHPGSFQRQPHLHTG